MSSTTQIRVTDSIFDCDNCSNTIERVLLKRAGVRAVMTDDGNQHLEVEYDPSQVEAETIEQVVERWGYTSG